MLNFKKPELDLFMQKNLHEIKISIASIVDSNVSLGFNMPQFLQQSSVHFESFFRAQLSNKGASK